MNDKTTLPVKFEWTDDLVFEYANTVLNDHAAGRRPMNVENFVRLKGQSYKQPDTKEKERIEVRNLGFYKNNNTWFEFELNKIISEDKFPAIKQAIENVLNGEMDNPAPSNQQGISLLEYFIRTGRHKEAIEYKSELEEAESKAWENARLFREGRTMEQAHEKCIIIENELVYPTLEDYRNSLNTINKEEKTKEQVVTDNSDVVGLKIDEDAFKNRCNVCGDNLVFIRGKYPNTDKRPTCPTCTTERLEQISEISNKDYGKAYQNKNHQRSI